MAGWDDLRREFAGTDQATAAKRRAEKAAQAQRIQAALPTTWRIDGLVQEYLRAMAAAGNPAATPGPP